MRKIITAILVPLLSATMFFGCFGGGDKLTTENVKNAFNNYTSSYILTKNDEPINTIFKNKTDASTNKDFTEQDVEGGTIQIPTHEKVMYITYNNEYGINNEVMSKTGVIEYVQLSEIYQRLLSTIFNYYANHNQQFYEFVQDEGIENKEVNELYKKVSELKKATDSFNSNKVSFEDSINIHNGIINSTPVLSKMPSLYYSYNKVVDASLDFVNYFKGLHKKYIFKIEGFDSSLPNMEKEYIERYVDEVILMLAESVYYENVKVFERNNVDVHNLKRLFNDDYENEQFNWVNTEQFKNLTYSNENGFLYANNMLQSNVANNLSDEEVKSAIKDLYIHASSFEQGLDNYKKIYNKSNLNNYNYVRRLDFKNDFSADNLSIKERSNLNYMKDFSATKMSTMFNALYGVVAMTSQ